MPLQFLDSEGAPGGHMPQIGDPSSNNDLLIDNKFNTDYLSGQLVHGQKGHAEASSVNIFVQAYFCPSKFQASSKYSKIF